MAHDRATIKDVAAAAGVSISTVSRTLSGKMFVEEETRNRVLKVVEELHYEPNMIAKGLKEHKTNTIAVILPDINSLYYSQLLDGIEEYANEKGYSIFISNSRDSVEDELRNLDALGKRLVDGIICLSVGDDPAPFRKHINVFGTPFVFLNRNLDDNISSISIDFEHGGFAMTEYLIKAGHQDIAGFFDDCDTKKRNMDRLEGFRRALWKYHLEEKPEYIVTNASTIQTTYECALKMFADPKHHPTAVFASEEMMVPGIYRAIQESGYKIPDDVSVTGFDNVVTTAFYLPPLTTYDSKTREIAVYASKILFNQIEKKSDPLQHLLVQGVPVVRESVAPLRKK